MIIEGVKTNQMAYNYISKKKIEMEGTPAS